MHDQRDEIVTGVMVVMMGIMMVGMMFFSRMPMLQHVHRADGNRMQVNHDNIVERVSIPVQRGRNINQRGKRICIALQFSEPAGSRNRFPAAFFFTIKQIIITS